VSFGVSAGFNYSTSESQSREVSAKRQRQITEKATSRSKTERKVEFHFATETGTSDLAFQEIVNKSATPVTWAYHRLMTKWKVSLSRYDVRMTYDLIVPDPADRLLRHYQRIRELELALARPDELEVAVTGVSRDNWQALSTKYGVPLESPPEARMATVAAASHRESEKKQAEAQVLNLTAPQGYQFSGGYLATWRVDGYGKAPILHVNTAANGSALRGAAGTFPWMYSVVWTGSTEGGSASLQVKAEITLTDAGFEQWQTSSWQRIGDAHAAQRERRRSDWQAELEGLRERLGGIEGLALRKREHEEIMRVALSWLVGPEFDFYPDELPAPDQDLGGALGLYTAQGRVRSAAVHEAFLRHADRVRFLHQAIEWENLIYIVYPYFWTHESRWEAKDDISHPDFVHQSFLRGGAARVVLTVRPGFEEAFLAYMRSGDLDTPLPSSHRYLRIAEEIKNIASTSYPYTPNADPPENVIDSWHEFTPAQGLTVKSLALLP
jgi:hypothetical protein